MNNPKILWSGTSESDRKVRIEEFQDSDSIVMVDRLDGDGWDTTDDDSVVANAYAQAYHELRATIRRAGREDLLR